MNHRLIPNYHCSQGRQRRFPNADLNGELSPSTVPSSHQTTQGIFAYSSQVYEHAFALQDCHSIVRNGKTYSGLRKMPCHRTCNIFVGLFL
jgi:hypothetical protein